MSLELSNQIPTFEKIAIQYTSSPIVLATIVCHMSETYFADMSTSCLIWGWFAEEIYAAICLLFMMFVSYVAVYFVDYFVSHFMIHILAFT